MAEDKQIKAMHARLPADLLKRLKIYCVENEIQMQTFLSIAIEEALDRREKSSRA